jgi:hypothetical protein
VVVLLLEPFYVAGGFALYLNSRITQEAWDVELRFRELAARAMKVSSAEVGQASRVLRKSVSGLLLAVGLLMFAGGERAVAASPGEPQEVIGEVLQDEDFENHTRTRKEWVPDEGAFDWLNGISFGGGAGIADGLFLVIKVLALALLVVVIGVVIYYLIRNYRGPREISEKRGLRRPPPQVVMGMAVTPESLPDDLLGQARKRWQEGEARAALSLLYRGALMQLITGQEIAIEASDTESECVGRVKAGVPERMASYFQILSEQWMRVAYSTLAVSDEEFEMLCSGWPFLNSNQAVKR